MPVFSFASHRSHHIYALLSVLFVFLLKFPKNAKKQLTGRNINAKMQSKLNRLIEARYPSVPPARPGSRGRERGHRRSVRTMPVVRMLGRQRRSAGLSQEFFVKRYHWLFGDVLFSRDRFSVYSMNRLAKRFIFFIIPRRRGRKTPDKKETV